MLEAILLQNHHLKSNSTFVFKGKESNSENKHTEFMLEKLLDLEKQSSHHLALTALDDEDFPEAMQLQHPRPSF